MVVTYATYSLIMKETLSRKLKFFHVRLTTTLTIDQRPLYSRVWLFLTEFVKNSRCHPGFLRKL